MFQFERTIVLQTAVTRAPHKLLLPQRSSTLSCPGHQFPQGAPCKGLYFSVQCLFASPLIVEEELHPVPLLHRIQ
ncbi:hypothetical protein HETIRDRAFT_421860 [Heterobasidion irregulare TC 32-1]|uniref:Uncharacterized protein n=1 Tax=Heterobasidion irregulare (strain TC 32-1) TaxID=747525 RepID=W4JTF5_HETIT|nr:uncharacterized protein HETIRDRAFT_421860 [Heterobasidion irregulare TC 32-1]ETW76385.1 hypothetical protein HETIRDRAFT_421860 [Heterobasidion irregulare TC 32-1]